MPLRVNAEDDWEDYHESNSPGPVDRAFHDCSQIITAIADENGQVMPKIGTQHPPAKLYHSVLNLCGKLVILSFSSIGVSAKSTRRVKIRMTEFEGVRGGAQWLQEGAVIPPSYDRRYRFEHFLSVSAAAEPPQSEEIETRFTFESTEESLSWEDHTKVTADWS